MNNCIDSKVICNRDIKSIVYVYIMIIIVIVLSLIIFLLLFHYKTYYMVRGIVYSDLDNYYLKVYVPIEDIMYFSGNSVLYIDDVSYEYSIISIDSEYYTNDIYTYVIVNIGFDIPLNYRYVNMAFEIKLVREDKRVIDYFI